MTHHEIPIERHWNPAFFGSPSRSSPARNLAWTKGALRLLVLPSGVLLPCQISNDPKRTPPNVLHRRNLGR